MRGGSRVVSDGERDERVVLGDVALEDVRDEAHDALEASPVELHAAQRAVRHNGGGARAVEQQRHLAEVVGASETAHLDARIALRRRHGRLVHDRLTLQNHVEVVARVAYA